METCSISREEEGRSRSREKPYLQKTLRSGGYTSIIHVPQIWEEIKDTLTDPVKSQIQAIREKNYKVLQSFKIRAVASSGVVRESFTEGNSV